MTDEKYTAKELEEMANALLAQDKSADKAKSAKPAVKAEKAAENSEKADDGKHPVASRGKLDEKAMAHTEAIILSMTPKEREKPEIIGASRKKRIAAGAGLKVEDVNRLLKSFEQMRKLIKQFSGPGAGKKMKRMGRMGGFGGFPGF